MFRLTFIFGGVMFLGSCISPRPYTEYVLADTALKAARESGGERLASVAFHEAERQFNGGEKAFLARDNDAARSAFTRAREKAEEAENAARLKRLQSGGTVP